MPVVDLIPLILPLLIFVVCWMLLTAYKSTLGALLGLLADALNVSILGQHPFAFISDGIKAFDSAINASLGQAMIGTKLVFAKVLHAHAILWHDLTGAVADLAEATEKQFRHLPRAVIESIIPAWVYPLRTTVHFLQKLLARVEAKVASLPRLVTNTVTHETTKVITKVEKVTVVKVKAAAVAIPRAIGIPLPRVGALERDVRGIDARIRDLLHKVSGAAIAAAVATAIGALGLSWARCSRVKKLGKAVCGLDDKLLDSLLADALVLASTISIVELAKECQGFLGDVEEPLLLFVRELRDINPAKAPNAAAALADFAAGRY
jgi:hypothetical protein